MTRISGRSRVRILFYNKTAVTPKTEMEVANRYNHSKRHRLNHSSMLIGLSMKKCFIFILFANKTIYNAITFSRNRGILSWLQQTCSTRIKNESMNQHFDLCTITIDN